jgi:hypothetical protein
MRFVNAVLLLTVGTLGAIEAYSALARGGGHRAHFHARVVIFAAAPVFPHYFFPYPAYAYPLVPVPDPTYIEQLPPPTVLGQHENSWYYCNASKTFYPYVKECPEGWQAVAPQPPPTDRSSPP